MPPIHLSNYVESIRFVKTDHINSAIVRFIIGNDVYLPIIEEITLQINSTGNVVSYKMLETVVSSILNNKYSCENLMQLIKYELEGHLL